MRLTGLAATIDALRLCFVKFYWGARLFIF